MSIRALPRPTWPAPGRFLYGAELERYARRLAARPELWAAHVRHEAGKRNYSELFGDDHLSAWLICWMQDNDTGFHDHDVSWGAVSVLSGCVREERLPAEGAPLDASYGAGESFCFSPLDIHRVRHAGAEPAVTLHVYSPPLVGMGAYEPKADGALHRVLIGASEELRAPSTPTPPASVRIRARRGRPGGLPQRLLGTQTGPASTGSREGDRALAAPGSPPRSRARRRRR